MKSKNIFLTIILFILNFLYLNGICFFGECCNNNYVLHNFDQLKKDLKNVLFGQPLVQQTIVNAIKAHVSLVNPPKALVLSLHGGTGTGKNHVATIIANNTYKLGVDSEFVKYYVATRDFPYNSKVEEYKEKLKIDIDSTIDKCKHSLFIFDEMDKVPIQLMDVIKPYVDFIANKESAKYRHSIFLFLSNSGAKVIADKAFDLYLDHVDRNEFQLKMFRSIIEKNIYSSLSDDKKGFWHLNLIKSQLIDHYIPFLPLEIEHVKMCIEVELNKNGFNEENRIEYYKDIDNIAGELVYEPEGFYIYSSSGCKRIPQLVRKFIYDIETLKDEF